MLWLLNVEYGFDFDMVWFYGLVIWFGEYGFGFEFDMVLT